MSGGNLKLPVHVLFVRRALFALVAFFVVDSALGQSPEPAKAMQHRVRKGL